MNKHFNIFFMVSNHIYSDVTVKLELIVAVDKCHPPILFTSWVKHFSKHIHEMKGQLAFAEYTAWH